LVFTKRTDNVGSHRGQISFPGGRVDPSDAGFLEAALRETEEEIGLPRTSVEPLGALDDTETVATQFIITPWVGLVRGAVAWPPPEARCSGSARGAPRIRASRSTRGCRCCAARATSRLSPSRRRRPSPARDSAGRRRRRARPAP